jgi:hypothetical protein
LKVTLCDDLYAYTFNVESGGYGTLPQVKKLPGIGDYRCIESFTLISKPYAAEVDTIWVRDKPLRRLLQFRVRQVIVYITTISLAHNTLVIG